MMSNYKPVWVDGQGDVRKKENSSPETSPAEYRAQLELKIRRLTSGKGRTVIEVSDLPSDKKWCKALAKDIKKKLGVGGSYKNDVIEVHGEKLEQVTAVIDQKGIKWKKTGG